MLVILKQESLVSCNSVNCNFFSPAQQLSAWRHKPVCPGLFLNKKQRLILVEHHFISSVAEWIHNLKLALENGDAFDLKVLFCKSLFLLVVQNNKNEPKLSAEEEEEETIVLTLCPHCLWIMFKSSIWAILYFCAVQFCTTRWCSDSS